VKAAATTDALVVADMMRQLSVDDVFVTSGRARADGAMVHDMFLARVKSPRESKGAWDDYEIIRKIPGDIAFRPLEESECPLASRSR